MGRHAQLKYVGEAPLITVFDAVAPLLSTNSSQVLVDDWVDLSEWGCLLSSNTVALDAWLEKPDGLGGYIPIVSAADYIPPGLIPANDPQGYTVDFSWLGDSSTEESALTVPLQCTIYTSPWLGSDPYLKDGTTFTDPQAIHVCRVRMVARADCSSGLYDSLGYRFHIRVRVPQIAIWEKEVPIPSADATIFLDEPLISLADLGVSSWCDSIAIVYAIKKNGKILRVNDFVKSIAGDVFDPPTYPIQVYGNAIHREQPWYGQQNGGNIFAIDFQHFAGSVYFSSYDSPGIGEYGVVTGGSWLGGGLGACNEFFEDTIKIAAWRQGAALTEYVAVKGDAPTAVPVGSADGCSLVVKIFKAPRYLVGFYPFNQAQAPWSLKVPLLNYATEYFPTRFQEVANINQAALAVYALSNTAKARLSVGVQPYAQLADVPEFVSGEILGDGTAQAIAHGLPDVSTFRVIPVKWPAGSACEFTATSDATNVTVTMTLGVTYIVMAWRPS